MSGDGCAEKACGQILFCLKMSNLNYMVKETPYSAYVTIRKKFTKVSNVETPPSIKVNESNEKLRKEHNLLEQKYKALYSENGHLKIDLENLEVKVEALETINADLKNKLDEAESKLEKAQTDLEEETSSLKLEKSKVMNENITLKA